MMTTSDMALKEEEEYTSKTKRGECKNDNCINLRREKSAYCQECSDEYKKSKAS